MNSTPTENLDGPPTANDFDRLVDRFERAWRAGTVPEFDAFLPLGTERRRVLEELVKIDLEYRWRTSPATGAGRLPARPLIEHYLQAYPELASPGQVPITLVAEEFRVRQRWGDHPSRPEYARRFPGLSELDSALQTVVADLEAEVRLKSSQRVANRYERRCRHAVGGLGEVWLAHDALVGRDVALKELRPELSGQPSLRRRFLQEAQLTGRLEHPGIVPLYELAEPSGACGPFYVMRFLHGRTLSEAIREYHRQGPRPLTLRALLGAFVAVCNTVAYAHSRDVIHRDLKPANILVGEFGEVIVLDWGLARLRRPGGEDTLPEGVSEPGLTQHGQILGTPAYMAPEQAAGEPDRMEERTDVFGLGAVLYEILTDRPPFVGRDTDEVLSQAKQCNPLPLRRVRSEVPAALEAICLKSLTRDPAERYATARDLAEDVQRWLADEPVRVFRDPLSTRIARWARRRRTLVASLAVLLITGILTLSVGTVLLAREQARTEAARERAETNFRRALAVVDQFCTRVSEETLLEEPGMQPLRKQLLGDALQFYREFVAAADANQGAKAELARASWRLGDLTEALAPGEEARKHYLAALEQFEALAAHEPPVERFQADAAGVQNSLGNWYLHHQQFEEAERFYRAALDRRRSLVERAPHASTLRRDLARSHNNLGVLHRRTERLGDAARELRAAAEEFAELVHQDPKSSQPRVDEAWARINLAVVLRANRERGADVEFRRAIELLETRDDLPAAGRAALAAAHNNLGELYRGSFQSKRAEESYRKALALLGPLARNNPAVIAYRLDLARCRFNLASVLALTFRPAEAEANYRASLDVFAQLAREYPSVPDHTLELGKNSLSLASLHALTGKNDAVVSCCEYAVGPLDTLARTGQPQASRLLRSLLYQRALALAKLERYAEAVRDWDQILELDQGSTSLPQRLERVALMTRAGQLMRAGEEAERMLEAQWTGSQLYDLAAVLARAAGAAEVPERERMANAAVELLARARQAGYFQRAGNVSQLRSDPDFNALRKHAGFVRLMEQLQP